MKNCYIDIETIPGQAPGICEEFINDAKDNFKAPSDMSKKRALSEMGLDGGIEPQKFWTKDDSIKMWENKFREEKYLEVADENYRKTSFDGAKGEIISVSFSDGHEIHNLHRKLKSKYTEYHMLNKLFTMIHKMASFPGHKTQPYFIGHNVRFDIQFMFHRAVALSIDPGFNLKFDGSHGKDFYCTMQAWSGFSKKGISQNNLARALGIPEKPGDIDGSKVWDFVKRGDVKRVAEYNNYDVETVIALSDKLTFKDAVTKPTIMAPVDNF